MRNRIVWTGLLVAWIIVFPIAAQARVTLPASCFRTDDWEISLPENCRQSPATPNWWVCN
jgi:hypothetical protein